MAFHPLVARNPRGDGGKIAQGFGRDLLPGHRLEEFQDRQPPGIARRPRGRQDMVGPRGLVAERHRRLGPEEERAVGAQAAAPPAKIGRLHMQMLGRDTVGLGRHRLAVVA